MNRHLGAERYELEHRLGHGGMATVYLARDLKLDREVAIKLLADNYAGDDEVRKRFSREARLAARLDHPNVVQVFDVGEEAATLVGSIVCLPSARTCLMASLIHSVCWDRQVVMLQSAADGASGTAVVRRFG